MCVYVLCDCVHRKMGNQEGCLENKSKLQIGDILYLSSRSPGNFVVRKSEMVLTIWLFLGTSGSNPRL